MQLHASSICMAIIILYQNKRSTALCLKTQDIKWKEPKKKYFNSLFLSDNIKVLCELGTLICLPPENTWKRQHTYLVYTWWLPKGKLVININHNDNTLHVHTNSCQREIVLYIFLEKSSMELLWEVWAENFEHFD